MTVGKIDINLDGLGLRIGIAQARFNEDVCQGLFAACLAELKHLGVADEDILHVTVPGALEIPLALQKMAETGQFDALNSPETRPQSRGSRMDLRTYGIGAQILKDIGVAKMKLLANPRKMPSMTGFDLETVGYQVKPNN